MTVLHRLLAPTDFSPPARHAAERAALLSRESGAALALFHVASLAPLERLRQLMMESPDTLRQRVLNAAQARLDELAGVLRERYGITAATEVAAGTLLAELTRHAQALAPSLIVCGATGESVIRHLLLGSTAERLLGKMACPVLVVKEVPREPYRRVLVPVDFSASSLPAIGHARAIAPQAEIILVHVFEVPYEGSLRYANVDEATLEHYRGVARQEAGARLARLSEEAALAPYATRQMVLQGEPFQRIIEQEQVQDCDLIVMGKHGESMLEDLLLGSVTRHVLAHARCDVLVSV